MKRYLTDLKMDLYLACSIAEGFSGEEDTQDEVHDAWQYLVDTGQCWYLQGWYGRTATDLLEQGLILPAKGDHAHSRGTLIPGVREE